ncbi:replication protein A 70 kDa DNA-binding subunit B-like [Silene latifolia]|uniref:replication protein A 70 kDa DNA-binding subunit B-like n=1 Tax=Silene latifolia TaxID=37657 RepID=UPI003D76C73C
MSATLFDQDIELFSGKFHEGKDYEITNATINPIPANIQRGSQHFQMIIKSRTHVVQTSAPDESHNTVFVPVNSCTDYVGHVGRIDIIAVVLAMYAERKVRSMKQEAEFDVRDLIITDQHMRPVPLTVWHEPLLNEVAVFEPVVNSMPVVHITRVRADKFGEGSWNTSPYSSISLNSILPEADAMRVWVHENISALELVRAGLRQNTGESSGKKIGESSGKKIVSDKGQEVRIAISSLMDMEVSLYILLKL